MLSKISSPTCGIPRLIILSILKQIQKRLSELASKQQMMLPFPSITAGLQELPDCPFEAPPNQLEKCQSYQSVYDFRENMALYLDSRSDRAQNAIFLQRPRNLGHFLPPKSRPPSFSFR